MSFTSDTFYLELSHQYSCIKLCHMSEIKLFLKKFTNYLLHSGDCTSHYSSNLITSRNLKC